MANKDDYLTDYRQFFEEFANTVEPNDQLPVKLGSYKFINSEVVGGIVDWCLQYLNRKSCPSTLIGPLTKLTIDEIRIACKKDPLACGFNPSENVYEPLKLMQSVMSKMNEICLRYLDNSQLDNLPAPPTVAPPMISMCASRNTRRRMEDRHIVIHDVNSMFNIQDSSPTSYYAIFDGHAGPDAASYSAAHLHQFLFESDFYPTDPEQALKEAFLRTDEFFLEKSKIENFRSGTTAVCALLRPKEETLYVAWVGDSQALLVNRGKVLQIVIPHKPSRQDEKDRIEANGGCVMFWGMWRVNGQLAVSRAIGDIKLKPYVTAEPDVVAVPLDGNEEFLIMACDGLWDFVSEDDAAIAVYNWIKENPDNVEDIAEHLSDIAKQEGSRDNISIIVVFLKDPSKIAKKLSADWGWTAKEATADAAMDTSVDNTNNTTNITTNNTIDLFDVFQKPVAIPEFKSNGTTDNNDSDLYFYDKPTNGKRSADDFDEEDEDFGPETDVDAVDDVLLSPTIAAAKALVEGNMNKNVVDEVDKMDLLDVEMELQMQPSEFEPVRDCREETPTPPADSVLDSSGLADNVAESGEDSEDEWNYYRVDPKQKENNENSLETNNTKVSSDNPIIDIESDEMSQLNPDAKEFVPVSPTRNNAVSPVPNFNRDVVEDTLVARSPRRALPMDNYVPSPEEFCRGIKQRPSELFEECDNKDIENQNQNGHQLSHQEIMQNLLNGKDPSEIEFHPSNYNLICDDDESNAKENTSPTVDDETPRTPPPVVETSNSNSGGGGGGGDDDNIDFTTSFVPRSQDPMSMSFYEDKDEAGSEFSTNPFDLNKVQVLPDNIDDIPLENNDVPSSLEQQKQKQQEEEEPPVVSNSDCSELLPKSPLLPNDQTTNDVCEIAESPSSPIPPIHVDVCETTSTSKSPMLEELTSSPVGPLSPKSPIPELTGLVSPDITASIKDENVSAEISESAKSPIMSIETPPPIDDDLIVSETVASPNLIEQNVSPFSTAINEDNITNSVNDEVNKNIFEINKEVTDLQDLITDAIQDITTSESIKKVKEEEEEEKYLSDHITSLANKINQISDIPEMPEMIDNDFTTACNNTFTSTSNVINMLENELIEEQTNKLLDDEEQSCCVKSEAEPLNTSVVESEVAPSEVMNSFLDRSIIPEVTSPLSPSNENVEKFEQEQPELWKCEYPLPLPLPTQHDIKCETIQPEFPVHIIASPSEETKGATDTPPTTPAAVIIAESELLIKNSPEPEKQIETAEIVEKLSENTETPIVAAEVAAAVAVVGGATAVAATVGGRATIKTKTGATTLATKKPPSKISPTSPSPAKALASSKTAASTAKKATGLKVTSTTSAKAAPAKPKASSLTPTASPKPIGRTPPAPKPKTPATTTTTTAASKSAADKKPLTNGDVKAPIRQVLMKKTTSSVAAAAKPSTATATAASKVNLTKSNTSSRPMANGTLKPSLSAPKTTTRPSITSTTAPRPRPASLTSKSTTTTAATTKVAAAKSLTATTKSPATARSKPSVTTTTTAAASRPRMVLTSKSSLKTPDTEKQIKETANKQISASRTSTTNRTTTRTSTTALKKIDSKAPISNRTSTTTTKTTTVKSSAIGRKPTATEVTKTTITKTKSSPAKTNVEQNGVVNVIQQITTVSVVSENNDADAAQLQLQLVKDNSPVDVATPLMPTVDNSQLPPMEIIAD